MAKEKRMNQSSYDKIVKELTSFGELISAHQDEKQSVMNDLYKEVKRFRTGKISRKALASSVPRVNLELNKIDKQIRSRITSIGKTLKKLRRFANNQRPKKFRATMAGVRTHSKKKKSSGKRKKK